MKNFMFIVFAVMMCIASSAHAINNPADITGNYGQIPVEFYKLCADVGDTRWLDLSLPINEKKDANLYLDNWTLRDGSSRGLGVMVSKAVSQRLQVTVSNDMVWSNGASSSSPKLWTGYNLGKAYISIVLPFEANTDPTYAVKTHSGNIHFFLQKTSVRGGFFYGVSFEIPKGNFSLDLAYKEGGDIRYLRVSKVITAKSGIFIPEIRTRFGAKDEIGFGLAFLPR